MTRFPAAKFVAWAVLAGALAAPMAGRAAEPLPPAAPSTVPAPPGPAGPSATQPPAIISPPMQSGVITPPAGISRMPVIKPSVPSRMPVIPPSGVPQAPGQMPVQPK